MPRRFALNYQTYDDSHGHGNPREWRRRFTVVMGLDEARGLIGDQSAEAVLGLVAGATRSAIRKAYRVRAFACHPDRCALHGLPVAQATEKFKRLTAALTVLAARRG